MRFLGNLHIRAKLTLAMSGLVAIILIETVVVARAAQTATDTNGWVQHTYDVIRQADGALDAMRDMESGAREYVLTGSGDYLGTYASGRAAYPQLLAHLASLTVDNPPQVARWQDLKLEADAWRLEVLEPQIEARGALPAVDASGLRALGENRRRLDALRAGFAATTDVEQALLAQRLESEDAAQRTLLGTLFGGAAAAILYAGLLSLGLGGLESRMLGRVARAAQSIAAGRLDERLRLDRSDEIGSLAAAFDGMADALESASADREQANLKLERLATTDPLTGAHNRRGATDAIQHLLALSRRHDQPLSLAILDLDHFKRVNDQHGHAMGDEVLHEFAVLLMQHVRTTDVVGRWGGEEFIVALFDCPRDAAITRLGAFRASLAHHPFTGVDGRAFHLNFSGGVAETPRDGLELDALQRLADAALYRAKAAGRGQCALAEPSLGADLGHHGEPEAAEGEAGIAGELVALRGTPATTQA